MFVDKKFRSARLWSNEELRKVAHLFEGEVVNVSAWKDSDKDGGIYRDYFTNATNYSRTNYRGYRGFEGDEDELPLDLTGDLPSELVGRFDVVLSHTTLEHIFDVRKAFKNLCKLSRDVVILVVPFMQVQHEADSWKDFWRFTPTCLAELFRENGLEVVYGKESPGRNSAVYLLYVGSRQPERWHGRLPEYTDIVNAGNWLGDRVTRRLYKAVKNRLT